MEGRLGGRRVEGRRIRRERREGLGGGSGEGKREEDWEGRRGGAWMREWGEMGVGKSLEGGEEGRDSERGEEAGGKAGEAGRAWVEEWGVEGKGLGGGGRGKGGASGRKWEERTGKEEGKRLGGAVGKGVGGIRERRGVGKRWGERVREGWGKKRGSKGNSLPPQYGKERGGDALEPGGCSISGPWCSCAPTPTCVVAPLSLGFLTCRRLRGRRPAVGLLCGLYAFVPAAFPEGAP